MLDQYPVIDGFTLRNDFRCDLTLMNLAVQQYDELRRVGNYRSKQWAFPQNPIATPIPAFDSSEKELRVGIGAVIWGYQLAPTTGVGSISGFQLRDACTDQAIAQEPLLVPQKFWPGVGGQLNPLQGIGPILLPRLLVIGKPGIVTIEVMTLSEEPCTAQIIFYGGVPVGVNA